MRGRLVRTWPATGTVWDCVGKNAGSRLPVHAAGWPDWPARAPARDSPSALSACRCERPGAPAAPTQHCPYPPCPVPCLSPGCGD
ncbi:hypothetical protein G6F24_018718 [Rhizopus arrhizus]|nr:hypothetical protein G6F24_018718 [Rhizopus arrhizus]